MENSGGGIRFKSLEPGFTLAEVLITLAIIGTVAALTVTTLFISNKEKGWNTASVVFERKLEEALKIMNTQQTLAGYHTTYDFVTELSRHLKITKICLLGDILNCFEDKITWQVIDFEKGYSYDDIDMSKVKRASDLGQDDWGTEVVGFQLNNGTTAIISYNPNCRQDPYSNQIIGTSCIAIIYDISGFDKPNTSGKDVRSINAKLGKAAFKIDGIGFSTPFKAGFIPQSECEKLKASLGAADLKCMPYDGISAAAMQCGGFSKLPTMAQLSKIASVLYGTKITSSQNMSGLTLNKNQASALGFPHENFGLSIWSGEYVSNGGAYFMNAGNNNVEWLLSPYQGVYGARYGICIVD